MTEEISLDSLNSKLGEAAKLLDECAHRIRDLDLDPKANNRRIGEALANVFEIQNQIYERRPDLTPNYLNRPKGS